MKDKTIYCVDQGGGKSQVNITKDQSPTLTTTHGGEPVVCLEGNGSRESHLGNGYKESDIMYTLNTVEVHAVCYGIDQQGGKGMVGYGVDVSPTLAAESHGTPHAVCYGISAYDSNAMKSSNPHSGIYQTDTTKTLDLNGGNPACNQGGMMIVQSYGLDSHNVSISEEKTMTMLQGKNDNHNVPCVYGIDRASFNQGKNAKYDFAVEEEIAQPLVARGPGGGVMTP